MVPQHTTLLVDRVEAPVSGQSISVSANHPQFPAWLKTFFANTMPSPVPEPSWFLVHTTSLTEMGRYGTTSLGRHGMSG